jgi:hypothetical protein
MHRMDPKFPTSKIVELLKFVDVDEDGQIKLDEFKLLFRQFDEANAVDKKLKTTDKKEKDAVS